jgi:hypothetical protein
LLLLCALSALALPAAGAHSRAAAHTLAREVGATHKSQLRALQRTALRRHLTRRITEADERTRYWLRVMHRPVPRPKRLKWLPLPELRRAAEWRRQRTTALVRAASRPPHLAEWLCIQRHETGGSHPGWRTNTGNGYFGGLQFDHEFQVAYGGWLYRLKGSAENWTPLEQMWTAEVAHASGRGFTPWPNTARMCGLL